MSSLNCPRSLTVAILVKYGEYDQVAKLRAIPSDYDNAARYHLAACASDWLRKYSGLPVTVDPELEAKKSWYQSERECSDFNNRYRRCSDENLELLLDVAADFISDVLGPCPLDLTPRFGPGATASDPASRTTILDKVSSQPTITEQARLFLSLWDGTAWERSHLNSCNVKKHPYQPITVEGNTFFTAPKTATIRRGCAKGPSINVSYQLSVGREIRGRLKSVLALDLAKGQAHHTRLAREGSLTGDYVTLDSERASDTMAYLLVKRLLSKSGFWFELCDALREPKTRIDEKWVSLEKFSAMGNGYTFELETLVFLSICYAVAWSHTIAGDIREFPGSSAFDLVRMGHITVYGDDVIVPSSIGRDVSAVLQVLGFTVNLKKSYFEGEFRESCGGDFFRGSSVNTPKLSEEPLGPADWFSIHNSLKARFVDVYPCIETAGKTLVCVKNQLPRKYRSMYGPRYLGDSVLHGWYGPQIECFARSVEDMGDGQSTDGNQWVGRLRVLTPRLEYALVDTYDPTTQLAYILYTSSSRAPARRPTRTLRYDVTFLSDDYHVIFEDYVPRAPRWLSKSPFARFFGITEDGAYVG